MESVGLGGVEDLVAELDQAVVAHQLDLGEADSPRVLDLGAGRDRCRGRDMGRVAGDPGPLPVLDAGAGAEGEQGCREQDGRRGEEPAWPAPFPSPIDLTTPGNTG